MNYGKNGIILDSQKPFVSEIGKVYVISFIGGVIGFLISFLNGHSIFEAFIPAAFFYLGAFAISDITISGIKYTAL